MQQEQNNPRKQFQSQSSDHTIQALAFCVHNPLGIHSFQIGGIGLVVGAPREPGNHYENGVSSTLLESRTLTGFDRLLLRDFTTRYMEYFQAFLENRGIDPIEAESIIGGLEV